jgi:ketosteroid isomerase-like protein
MAALTLAKDDVRARRLMTARRSLPPGRSRSLASVGARSSLSSRPAARAASVNALAIQRKAAVTGRRNTCRAMADESTTPDPVELTRRAFEAADRRDLDAVSSFFASDAVFEGQVGNLRGRAEIRSFLDEWFGAYDELEFELEDVRNLGSGVVFAVVVQEGALAGSAGHGHVRLREGWVFLWERDLIARRSTYEDIDEARAAAERLAAERA